jgi:N-methylhydantoinase B/acetone carboxylase alpha subunit
MMHAPLQMTVSGEGRLELSFEGANKWGFHSFNCAPSPMQGAMWVLLTQTLWNSDKINDGAYFATGLRLPYGSWCNPDYEKVSTTLTWFFLIPGFSGMIRAIGRSYFARGYVEDISASYAALTRGLAVHPRDAVFVSSGGELPRNFVDGPMIWKGI